MNQHPSNYNNYRQEGHSLEQQLLATALIYGRKEFDKIQDRLGISDFQQAKHQNIFGAMLNIYNEGGDIDFMTVSDAFMQSRFGGSQDIIVYLGWLIEIPVNTETIEYNISKIKEVSLRHKIKALSRKMIESCLDNSVDTSDLLSGFQDKMLELSIVGGSREICKLSELIEPGIDELEKLSNGDFKPGMNTGINNLDGITSGLWPTDLILIAARPSMGKSALMLSIIYNQICNGIKPITFNLEMDRKQIRNRLLSIDSGVDLMGFRTGNFTRSDWDRIVTSADALTGMLKRNDLIIDDTAGISVDEICRKTKQAVQKDGVQIVFIDYLQLIGLSGKKSRNEELGYVTRKLKGLAKELQIPVVALSQLNRKLEERNNKRPVLSDLRDSGELENDADVICFVYRDIVYNESAKPSDAEIIVAKQRNGPVATVPAEFIGKNAYFIG